MYTLNRVMMFLLFFVGLAISSTLLADPAGNAGHAVKEVVKLILVDKADRATDLSEGMANWITASAHLGAASFTKKKKDSEEIDTVVFELKSLEKLKVALTEDQYKTVAAIYEQNKNLVGKKVQIQAMVLHSFKGAFYKADLVALEGVSDKEPVGSVLARVSITEETYVAINAAYDKALELEKSGVKPRGGSFGPRPGK